MSTKLTEGNSINHSTQSTCFHCGDNCEEIINHDSKEFCCHGCVTVYDILKDNNLETYYELNGAPGTKSNSSTHKFEYLENEEIVKGLLDFKNDNIEKITLKLPAIHCSSCIWLLENLTTIIPGVKQSRVNFIKKEAAVLYDSSVVSLQKLVNFLCSIGYEPDLKRKSKEKSTDSYSKSLIIKLAVAGFFFGNSMLISLPHYLDDSFLGLDMFSQYFGILNILFTLPVLLYSSADYFKSAYAGLKNKFLGIDVPISLGILTLFIRSTYEILSQTGAGYSDSLCGLVFFLLIGKWYQNKTYRALAFDRDYKSFFPIAVNKVDDKGSNYIPIEELKVGDQLLIRNQEVIPADCTIVEGISSVDYSFVTGESDPHRKSVGDLVYAGGRHFGSLVKVEIVKEVSSSYLTSLWNQSSMKNEKNNLQTAIDGISSYFTIAILLIAAVTAGYWAVIDPSKIWNTVTSVLIVACPCALALAVPFTYGHVLRVFGSKGFYLKNASIIEHLAKLKLLVFDKTGTITTSQSSNLKWVGPVLTESSKQLIKTACSNSMHPYSRMIATHYQDVDILTTESFDEEKGRGITAIINGLSVFVGAAPKGHEIDSEESVVFVEIEGEQLGYYVMKATLKSGILDSLTEMKPEYEMHLVSGDNNASYDQLSPYFHRLLFNQRPKDKLNHIQLTDEPNSAMIGDGLNDAGALTAANVGISVVEDLHQFSPACDAIIKGDQLVQFPDFLRFSKASLRIVYAAFILSFLYNFIGMSFAVLGFLTPLISAVLMPISSVTVVGFVTLAINFMAKKSLRF